MPGPGAYLDEKNLNHMIKATDSFSKKGLGNGFISKVDRFKNNSLYYSKFLPGPGSYTTATHSDSIIGLSTQSSFMPSQKYKC